MKKITLTLVIPAYNESRHLKLCLDAVKAQQSPADEVIVVDNNSTDNTAEIAAKYKFVKVVQEKQQGRFYARSKGFNVAKSQIIGRIDADTILPVNWVADVKAFYANNPDDRSAWTSAGYSYNIWFPKLNGWVQSQIVFRFNRVLLGHYVLWGSTMALPKEQWRAVRSKTCARNDIHEDLDLAIHLHELGYKIYYASGTNVAVYMRRVMSDRHSLWAYLMLWPKTLKVHNMKTWVFSWGGAVVLYLASPIGIVNKRVDELSESKLFQMLKVR